MFEESSRPSSQHQSRGVIASTRPVRLRGEDRIVCFTRQALDGMAAQFNQNFIPLNSEHLGFLPPIGRIDTAAVIETDDGEFELHIAGPSLQNFDAVDEPEWESILADPTEASTPELSVKVSYTPRNFDESVAREILDDIRDVAQPDERWSEWPPLEFAFLIPVVWGVTKFAGSFLDELGRAAGNAVATKIGSWVRRSKQPDRTVVLALKFHLPDESSICGYVLAAPGELQGAVDRLLAASEELAVIAGLQKEIVFLPGMKDAAFFLDDGQWHLGWWTDGEAVFRTAWFEANPPDVNGVLGRRESE